MAASRIRPWMVATLLCIIYIVFVLVRNNGNPLALVTIGTRFSERQPNGSEGYDGQFVYYIARDPATAAQFLDVPAYRFQRILLPAMGRIFSFGQTGLIPWTLLLINLFSLAAGTWLLEQLLRAENVSRWYALTYGLTIGIFGSVRLSLSEPLTYGLVLGGIWLAQRQRWAWNAVIFALAGLAKETALFFPAGYAIWLLSKRQWRESILIAFISTGPFIVWQFILRSQFGSFGIGSGGALATSFEIIPFAGVARIITEAEPEARMSLILIFGVILIPFVIVPTLWGLWRWWRDWSGQTAYTWLLFANSAIMLFVPFSTYREPIGILRFIVGLQIALILYTAERRQMRALRNSTIWILTIFFAVSLVTAG